MDGARPNVFVNPYTFLPFPPNPPVRRAPHGHTGDRDLWSGRLEIEITAVTPLLVRAPQTDGVHALPSRPDGTGGRQTILPGSTLHGALRSLHEAMCGSCLRIFDNEFVPGYRQEARVVDDLQMAVVRDVDAEGRPREVQLCAQPADPLTERLNHEQIRAAGGAAGLDSGTRLSLVRSRDGKIMSATVDPTGEWMVHISAIGARSAKHRYRAAVRRLTAERVVVGDSAWGAYQRAVEGAEDLRPAHGEQPQPLAPVTFTYRPLGSESEEDVTVGRRYRASRRLHDGQPIWVRIGVQPATRRREVVELRLSQIWRRVGTGAAGDRIPDGFGPCSDPALLCSSCRLFGSADTREDGGDGRTGVGRQRSYRGHVRISDAVPAATISARQVVLPPMGAPRPGSGQFYLDNAGAERNGGVPALREWGSAADGDIRRLRGRKFYWHTSDAAPAGRGRGEAREHQRTSRMATSAMLFPTGATFRATLTVVDVDEAQLGGLTAALEPGRILDEEELVQHVGGGKPLGYGSCRIRVVLPKSRLWRSGQRYGASGHVDQPLADVMDAAIRRFVGATDGGVRAQWPALTRLLRLDEVNPAEVWYPPGQRWDQQPADPPGQAGKAFDEGWEFWRQTSGSRAGGPHTVPRKGFPLTSLPHLTAADQSLPIVIERTTNPLTGREL